MATFVYYIETRQRIKGAAHYMEWRRVPGKFTSRAKMDDWAAWMVEKSHSLDIRGVRIDGTLRHTINYRIGA